ncbi:MAG: glycosyltransferase family 39 protein [Nitrospina sp.]|jgi:4-amino-4-deoxy-L-arabinose transferase-like glycosyltransferase|nr:glycosyltransferase family 39 protein [Nitrospina sp.]MBT5633600.1 glycosyltransferase family 39 protein [Nitrospina sp.]
MFSPTSDSQTKSFNPSKFLFGIFFIALAFRLWGVTNPLLDFHGWRQTLTATFAYNFYVDGMNFFNPRPSMINSIFHFEFPLYTYLVALLYKVFGFHEILGRIVAIGFSMGSIWFLYLLGKRYFDKKTALVACGFYAVLPFSVYYSRTFMPESTMLFFSISMVYMFARWLDTGKWSHFLLASLLATLAFLVKLPTLYMGGPLLLLAWSKYRGQIFYQPLLYIFVALILAPPALWYSYIARLQFETYGGGNLWLDMLKDWEVLLTLRYWKLIFWTRLVEKMFAFTVFPFLIMGMRAPSSNKERYVLHTWFFCVCAYFIIAAKYNFIHEYYQVPIIPVGCLFAGKFISDFYTQNISKEWHKSSKVWVVLIMIIFIPLHSVYKLKGRLNYNDTYLNIGAEIRNNTKQGDLIIANQDLLKPHLFYYGQRKGWGTTLDKKLSPETLTEYVEKGARLYIMVEGNLEETDPELYEFLNSRHQFLRKDDKTTLYKLLPR